MSFTDGKPFLATESSCQARWSGGKPGEHFRCGFCGYKFVPGDTVRWQYTNDIPGAGGNPLVCIGCDQPYEQLIKSWKSMHAEASGRMWWFCRRDG
jgi:hypothetical protein